MTIVIDHIEGRTPVDISAAIGRLISTGQLSPGDRLPTVRGLAEKLGISPATVSHAWQALAAAGLIESHGRNGTFVRKLDAPERSSFSQPHSNSSGLPQLDLSRGTPDPQLLPRLGRALSRVSERAETSAYMELPVIPELLEVLASTWPYPVEAITIVNGALDAISRSIDQIARFGDRVVVENPGFPPFFDLLKQLGLEAVPVEVDEYGIEPESFAQALQQSPTLVILQPRAQNPTGASMLPDRAKVLAQMIGDDTPHAHVVVIEDDHSGEITVAPDVSLGTWIPERVLHVRSFSKSHGPDLRIAALGGPMTHISEIESRRMLGPGWTSRMLQTILHDLLTTSESVAEVADAGRVYFSRQKAFAEALRALGMNIRQADGINAWIPVDDEHRAIMQLSARGIRVAGGASFFATEPAQDFVRVTAGVIDGEVVAVAHAIAAAASSELSGTPALTTRWA
ncbi:MAG: aminotransferase class I/II-fold pyridoxal phosphate-dependent enzyme [Microbacteriaceae bacterium]|nr:aminotransferase class I/II-fold pyridoxal phosphate-dependent enzyme [Microbacteriaceae bacterium]